jgi:hypothetical protein
MVLGFGAMIVGASGKRSAKEQGQETNAVHGSQ